MKTILIRILWLFSAIKNNLKYKGASAAAEAPLYFDITIYLYFDYYVHMNDRSELYVNDEKDTV